MVWTTRYFMRARVHDADGPKFQSMDLRVFGLLNPAQIHTLNVAHIIFVWIFQNSIMKKKKKKENNSIAPNRHFLGGVGVHPPVVQRRAVIHMPKCHFPSLGFAASYLSISQLNHDRLGYFIFINTFIILF